MISHFHLSRETSSLRKRFATLGGAQKLVHLYDMSHFLRSIRLASHLARQINQCFPS